MTITDGLVSRSLDVPGARLHYEVRGQRPAAARHRLAHGGRGIRPAGPRPGHRPHRRHLRPPRLRGQHQSTIPDRTVESGSARRRRRGDPRRPRRPVGRRVRLQRRRGDRAGVGHPSPRPGAARSSPTNRRCWSCCPTPRQQRAATADIVETFRPDGLQAAWMKFMVNAGFDVAASGADADGPEPEPANPRTGTRRGRPLLPARPGADDAVRARLRGAAGLGDRAS